MGELERRICQLKKKLNAVIVARELHPECVAEVIALADAVLSTSQMVYYAKASEADEFLVGTEEGLLHRLRRETPEKSFHLIGRMVCKDMKKTTLESIVRTMELQQNTISVPEEIRVRAKSALDRMLKIGATGG